MNVTNLINLSRVEFPDFWKTHNSPFFQEISFVEKHKFLFCCKRLSDISFNHLWCFWSSLQKICILQKSLHKSCAINVKSWSRFSLTKYTQCVLFETKLPIRMLMAKALWCRMIIDGTWAVCSHDWCDQCVTLHCTSLLTTLHYNGLYVGNNGF